LNKPFNSNRWYISGYLIICLSLVLAFIYAAHNDLNRKDGKLLIAVVGLIAIIVFCLVDQIRKKVQHN
jgi:hypothetical protein